MLVSSFFGDSRNRHTTQIRGQYFYDRVGNITRIVDGRGVATDFKVNQWNQVITETRSAANGIFTPDPAEPLALTDFGYVTRYFYDANDNLMMAQVEDRGNTSGVDGNLALSDLPSTTTDPDPIGGKAYVDTAYKFDILDQVVESVQEVANGATTTVLRTRHRYDKNENRVLTILPEGNAIANVYDERDLLFQSIRGATGTPTLINSHASDPTTFSPRGGDQSVTTYNYDRNGNGIETVDAEDTDNSSNNGSDVSGAGDRTREIYDSFDRPVSQIDAVGNQTVYQYDPAGNVVRVTSFGPVGGSSPTSDGPEPP